MWREYRGVKRASNRSTATLRTVTQHACVRRIFFKVGAHVVLIQHSELVLSLESTAAMETTTSANGCENYSKIKVAIVGGGLVRTIYLFMLFNFAGVLLRNLLGYYFIILMFFCFQNAECILTARR